MRPFTQRQNRISYLLSVPCTNVDNDLNNAFNNDTRRGICCHCTALHKVQDMLPLHCGMQGVGYVATTLRYTRCRICCHCTAAYKVQDMLPLHCGTQGVGNVATSQRYTRCRICCQSAAVHKVQDMQPQHCGTQDVGYVATALRYTRCRICSHSTWILGVVSKQLRLLHGRVEASTTPVNSLSTQMGKLVEDAIAS